MFMACSITFNANAVQCWGGLLCCCLCGGEGGGMRRLHAHFATARVNITEFVFEKHLKQYGNPKHLHSAHRAATTGHGDDQSHQTGVTTHDHDSRPATEIFNTFSVVSGPRCDGAQTEKVLCRSASLLCCKLLQSITTTEQLLYICA